MPERQHDWCRQLGLSHRQRDAAAVHDAHTLEARDRERHSAVRRRWPKIAAAVRELIDRYNEGAGREMLTVVDDAGDQSRDHEVHIVALGGRTLTIALTGVDLCVSSTPVVSGAADEGRRWIAVGPTDEASAANALQHWLTQL